MSEDVGLVAVVAHRTLNDLAAIQGPLTTARRLTVDDPVRAQHLLDLAEKRINESLDTFRASLTPPALRPPSWVNRERPSGVHGHRSLGAGGVVARRVCARLGVAMTADLDRLSRPPARLPWPHPLGSSPARGPRAS